VFIRSILAKMDIHNTLKFFAAMFAHTNDKTIKEELIEDKLGEGKSVDKKPNIEAFWPSGHFYSPVVNPKEVEQLYLRRSLNGQTIPGIDFNDSSHSHILEQLFPRYIAEFDYPESADESDPEQYFLGNDQFGWLDARALFVLLREWKPAKYIEVGSGFSSLLLADINRKYFDLGMEATCIEPYPRPFLREGREGINKLIIKKVQQVDLAVFTQLAAGDVLFIDTSHVCKTGSDVNFLYFEVLPRLQPGVIVHIHDIFLPHEYPEKWVIEQNRSWNEQYLLRALLMYSPLFKVIFGSSYAHSHHREKLERALNVPAGKGYGGSSFWLERT
jgi:hypothetical protein